MNMSYIYLKRALLLTIVMLLCMTGEEAQAQFKIKWLTIGAMQSPYSEAGAVREQEPFDNAPLQFPAVDHRAGNTRAGALWVGARNFTDEEGRTFSYKLAHVGPRAGGEVQFFPQKSEVISRFEDTDVQVDGAKSFLYFTNVDGVDPNIKADRVVNIVNNNRVGIQMDQTIHAFSNQFHDNYHIMEYEFTNTGNVDNDLEAELNAPLEGVYFYFISRYSLTDAASWVNGNGAPWGKFTMNDAVGDGHEDYGVDFRAQYAWYGHNVFQADYNCIGGPLWASHWTSNTPPDTSGRLAGGHFVGRVYIHADRSATDGTDDEGQPSTMGVKGSDNVDLVDSEFDIDLMTRQYQDFMEAGRMYPHHADQIEPDGPAEWPRNFANPSNDPASFQGGYDEGGWAMVEGFGPYDMAIGETVKLVIAEGVAGLSDDAKLQIGAAYKASGADDAAPISYTYGATTHAMTKNEWVMTSRDSLFQMFERAIANYESGLNIPRPPLPPSSFTVTSGADQISLEWETFSGATQTGFEIYRAGKTFKDPNGYELVATLGPDARSYNDTDVERGVDQYYYIVATGAVNTDATGNTPTGVALHSGRYYTQTYLPASLKRRPGTTLDDIRIVPNPFNIGADADIRWPDKQDKLGFLDIPGQCTISIYTQLGELITTIEHTDGSGDEFWDHTTDARQVIASGIYIAVIKNLETNDSVFKKFVIIR